MCDVKLQQLMQEVSFPPEWDRSQILKILELEESDFITFCRGGGGEIIATSTGSSPQPLSPWQLILCFHTFGIVSHCDFYILPLPLLLK